MHTNLGKSLRGLLCGISFILLVSDGASASLLKGNGPSAASRQIASDPSRRVATDYDGTEHGIPTDDDGWPKGLVPNYTWSIGLQGNVSNLGTTSSPSEFSLPTQTGFGGPVIGCWIRDFGFDLSVAYSASASTIHTRSSTSTTAQATTGADFSRSVTTFTDNGSSGQGFSSMSQFAIGVMPKYRVYKNDWFTASVGVLLSFMPGYSMTSIKTSTTVVTPNAVSAPNTFTTTNNGTTSENYNIGSSFTFGPNFGATIYPKWLPHLSLGFNTGLAFSFNGDSTKSTSTTGSISTTTTSGVAGTPSAVVPTIASTGDSVSPGTTAGVVSGGNSTAGLLATFKVSYEW